MKRSGRTVAQTIDDVANGRIGHRAAMDRLGLEFYPDLLETMRANGRCLWAHRPMAPDPKTLELLRIGCGLEDKPDDDGHQNTAAPTSAPPTLARKSPKRSRPQP